MRRPALALAVFLVPAAPAAAQGLLPDLRTVVPRHLQIQNAHQRETLRFSNAIANTGAGPLRVRPVFPVGSAGIQDAVQEILDAAGNVVEERIVSRFEFHPEHKHWHIADVALYEVRSGGPAGPLVGANSVKTTFCLIDWYKLEGSSRTPDRAYFDCNGSYQGISPGWVDQYHQSLEGQGLDLTGAPPGAYCLVSTVNPDRTFLESDPGNNTAWVEFELTRDSRGNARLRVTGSSPCESPGLCGDKAPNR